jgi:hypothetical protein
MAGLLMVDYKCLEYTERTKEGKGIWRVVVVLEGQGILPTGTDGECIRGFCDGCVAPPPSHSSQVATSSSES